MKHEDFLKKDSRLGSPRKVQNASKKHQDPIDPSIKSFAWEKPQNPQKKQKSSSDKIQYQKINPVKPKDIDIDSLLAEFINDPEKKKKDFDLKKKSQSIKPKQLLKKTQTSFKMILTKFSVDLINSFKQILEQKFSLSLNQLQKQRCRRMEKMFTYLCFGFQQISQTYQNDKLESQKIEHIKKQGFLNLLKIKVLEIDRLLNETYNQGKLDKSTLKFDQKWKEILKLLKEPGNSKLRQAVLTNQIQIQYLVHASQNDLIEYLSPEKQKQIRSEIESCLKNLDSKKEEQDKSEESIDDQSSLNQKEITHDDSKITEYEEETQAPSFPVEIKGPKRSEPSSKDFDKKGKMLRKEFEKSLGKKMRKR